MSSVAESTAVGPSAWQTMQCELLVRPNRRAAIGLIALANDSSIEPDIWRFLPAGEAAMYTNRVPMANVVTVETLQAMEAKLTESVAGLMPDDELDVIAYGCTSGTMAIGADRIAARIHEAKPGIAVTDPISASLKGLRHLGCKRIALLTPYTDSVNDIVVGYIEARGFDIAAKGSFKQPGDPQICRISPQAIYAAGQQLGSAGVDALFISCTGLRVAEILQPLEDELGEPVVASNQALAWDALRLAGYGEPVTGYGRLLRI
ncbi:MAG: Asp/Glu racemase [Gammaproteobacteria bacterium]|nr:Asp/Glu racemase [Gammaproteobacteria bacterium]MDH3464790.1 Asp/Glu racemase [Gammaproteobacteria bacterium]